LVDELRVEMWEVVIRGIIYVLYLWEYPLTSPPWENIRSKRC
jgi:hypothetical protein